MTVTAQLLAQLESALGADLVSTRATDLVRMASDASPYRLMPQVVVSPRTTQQVAQVLRLCHEHHTNATFRAGGTSLSGQATSDAVLIDVRRHWFGMRLEGELLRARPGTVLGQAAAVLARSGRRLGPDPASASAACLGGVVANNAAGMRCRIDTSSYATLEAATIVLPSGTVVDTAAPDAEERFAREEPRIAQGLMDIRREILADEKLHATICRKYAIRNTTGYTMKAFLDGESPVQILRRLMVGSEGTLGFLAEVVLRTLPVPTHLAACWVHAADAAAAVQVVDWVREQRPEAVEMLKTDTLRRIAGRDEAAPAYWKDLPAGGTSVLVEFAGESVDELLGQGAALQQAAAERGAVAEGAVFTDPERIAHSWKVRGSLHSDIATMTPPGAVTINEDVCFPPDRLAEGVAGLSEMLVRYGYPDYVVGHAAWGNAHFSLTPMLDQAEGREKYGRFMDELAELVVDRCDGSLKAEHGTGINMALFVEREWGPEVYALMVRVKDLIDPHRVLGRDVMITDVPGIHLQRFKDVPQVNPVVDGCIECGFCEPVCPSRNLTTTPRQRIVLLREIAREGSSATGRQLRAEFEHDGIDTCAVDSMCATACPYGIDTGAAMKQLRAEEVGPVGQRVGVELARHWEVAERAGRAGVGLAHTMQRVAGRHGQAAMDAVLQTARRVGGPAVPSVPGPMPRGAADLPATRSQDVAAVYFPACVTGSSANPPVPAPRCRCRRHWWRCRPGRGCRSGSPTTWPAPAAARCGAARDSSTGVATCSR